MPDDDPQNKGGFRAIVAIADVAHYVLPGSAIDREAQRRGHTLAACEPKDQMWERGGVVTAFVSVGFCVWLAWLLHGRRIFLRV
jgi:hypothetical protein